MTTGLLLAAALGGLFLLCACQNSSRPSVSAPPLIGTEWRLTELNGKPFVLSQGSRRPTLKLDGAKNHARGTSGINRFAGPCELDGASRRFGMFIGTRRAGPPEAMAAEDNFLAVMRQVRGCKLSLNELALTAQGKTILRFQSHR